MNDQKNYHNKQCARGNPSTSLHRRFPLHQLDF